MRYTRKFVVFSLSCVGAAVLVASLATAPPALAQGVVEFSDDFDAGIDTGVWYVEHVNNAEWVHVIEGSNGLIRSLPQNPWNWGNRMTDILTHQDDFTDFTMTWDMRFHNSSWNKDHRYVYFRSDNAVNVHGYIIHIGVWIPTIPDHVLKIFKINPDYTLEFLHEGHISYPWVLAQWYSFRLEVCDTRFKLRVWPRSDPEPTTWVLDVEDTGTPYGSGRIGFGNYWEASTDVDNVVVWGGVALDIKPRSCPNPLNIKPFENIPPNAKAKKGGVLPVAVLGAENFDVHDIDVSTVLLEGVAPIRDGYEDVSAPVESGEECACTTDGPDGFTDLTLKFQKSEIAATLGYVENGDVVPLTLTGELNDGTPFEATDCVVIGSKTPELPIYTDNETGKIVLGPAVPNPFNPGTRISYKLAEDGFVRLAVFDVNGTLVDNLVAKTQSAGDHVVEWDAGGRPSGIYFYRLTVGDFTESRKMILLK